MPDVWIRFRDKPGHEDQYQLKLYQNAHKYKSALEDLYDLFRRWHKYEEKIEVGTGFLRDEFAKILTENDVDLWD